MKKTFTLSILIYFLCLSYKINAQNVIYLDDRDGLLINSFCNFTIPIRGNYNLDSLKSSDIIISPRTFSFSNIEKTIIKSDKSIQIKAFMPDDPKIVGIKKILVKIKDNYDGEYSVNIGGLKPKIYDDIEGQIFSIGEQIGYQDLLLKGLNLNSINQSTVEIQETSKLLLSNSIIANNTILLKVKIKESNNDKFTLTYKATYFEDTTFHKDIELTKEINIPFRDIGVHQVKNISLKSIYNEDIRNNEIPITFEVPERSSNRFEIISDSLNFTQIYYDKIDNKVTAYLNNTKFGSIKSNKIVKLTLKKDEKEYYDAKILIKSNPSVKSAVFYNNIGKPGNKLKPNYNYTVEFFGENLEDLDFYIRGADSSIFNFYSSVRLDNFCKYTLFFRDINNDKIPDVAIGDYYVSYRRKYNNKYINYPDTFSFSIVEPMELLKPFPDKISSFSNTRCFDESDINYTIVAENIPFDKGPQYFEISANLFNDKGQLVNKIIYKDTLSNEYITCIGNSKYYEVQPKFEWDIKNGFGNDKIKPFNRIEVLITAPKNKYKLKSNILLDKDTLLIKGRWYDYWEVTGTVPPTIILFTPWGVKSDSTELANGAPEKKIVQFSNLNLGLGFNRILREPNFKKQTRHSFGAYCLWSNIAGSDSSSSNIIDKGDFSFLPYYQFSIVNTDTNLRVPIFAGLGISYVQRKEKWQTSMMFGLGINFIIK